LVLYLTSHNLSTKDEVLGAEYSVFGLENPLFDRIAAVAETVIAAVGAPKGTMNLVDYSQMRKVLALAGSYRSIPGGSAANTARGVAFLSRGEPLAPPVYCGAVGSDPEGEEYDRILRSQGVVTRLARKRQPTGCSVILVTPDRERTMFTFLGACREYTSEDLDRELLAVSRYLYLTGYMWDTENQKQAALAAGATALREGVRVAFDLADPSAVRRYREQYLSWIPAHVEVLFGNREEFRLLLGEDLEDGELAEMAGELCPQAVLKIGAEGCLVNFFGKVSKIAGFPVRPVDTTAAGDCFAAGYLYGQLREFSAERSARLANRLASGIVTVEGCDLDSLDPAEVLRAAG
jgi:sugar/nucleoside kinase (ribokinase family)